MSLLCFSVFSLVVSPWTFALQALLTISGLALPRWNQVLLRLLNFSVCFSLHACLLNHFSHIWLFATPWAMQPARLLCPWDSPGKNTGVGCQARLQGIFLTQGSNWSLCTAGRFFTTEPHASVYCLTSMIMFIPLPFIISVFSKAFCLIWSGNICVTGISICKPQSRKVKPPKFGYPRSLNFSA